MSHPLHTLGCWIRRRIRPADSTATAPADPRDMETIARELERQLKQETWRRVRAEDAIERIRALTQDEDGNLLPPESELPVGVFYGVLYGTESR